MNIVVAGYDKMLAALISGAKLKGHNILGVFRIDRVKYSKFTLFFKDIFAPSIDYSFIKSHNLYDIKAKSVNSKEFINEIKHLNPDVILVGSWSEKFGAEILNIPKYGIINCHPSLLPNHRGANPYFWAIYSGDKKTGITFHQMDENFDSGDILMQASFDIPNDITGGALKNKASKVAELMTGELLDDLENNRIISAAQDNSKAVYDKYPFDGIDIVDFTETAQKTFDKIRGLKPWCYCSCVLKMPAGERVYRIKSAKIPENIPCDIENIPSGTIIQSSPEKHLYTVKCSDFTIEIKVF